VYVFVLREGRERRGEREADKEGERQAKRETMREGLQNKTRTREHILS